MNGKVLRQIPAAGTMQPKGKAIRLIVGEAGRLRVPNVVGMKVQLAVSAIAQAGLRARKGEPAVATASGAQWNTVARQDPAAGVEAKRLQDVTFWLYGPAPRR